MPYVTSHHPFNALFMGRDPHGNYTFKVESGSTPDRWYTVIIWHDGSGGVCECPAFVDRQTCTMVEMAGQLQLMADSTIIGSELMDIAHNIIAQLKEDPTYAPDEATSARIRELEERADHYLDDRGPNSEPTVYS